jgi:bifunctional non-homologous end joining protein LigD
MLASTGEAPLESPDLVYEPKYDGIRAIATVNGKRVRLWSRLGNEKTSQFPEVTDAIAHWGAGLDRPTVVDGEIVALDERGEPAGFQHLQGRIHLKDFKIRDAKCHIAFIAFDLLQHGDEDLRQLPLRERRTRLERLLGGVRDPRLRLSEQVAGDGRAMHARAEAHGWEGLIAKVADSVYRPGRRTPDWRKLKLVRHQTCVIGGWTDPRGSRPFFGALLLGVYDDAGALHYIGHTGAGFTDAELGRVWKQLHALQTKTCPFRSVPRTNERPHWVRPQLVAEVKFTEWTADGKLRHPTYLGLRDDVRPESVIKEPDVSIRRPDRLRQGYDDPPKVHAKAEGPRQRNDTPVRPTAAERPPKSAVPTKAALQKVLDQLDAIEADGGSGVLSLPGGRLEVSNLGKVFWPARSRADRPLTKGDLFRHYVRVAPAILPTIADRPLVMKRYPNGISGKPFYQHRAADRVPEGVRVDMIATGAERRPHVIGGSLIALLYTTQLASISQDPWFSRIGSEDSVDHVAIDLDPPEDLPFARVLDVARWVRDELELLKAPAFPKTSGAGGLHIYVPMPPATPYDAGLLFCQIVATMVARKHPKSATVERAINARGRRIYVDYLQNIKGKTLASAYSARANPFAGVSTPVTWDEVEAGVTPQDFTIRNIADRLADAGDLWATLRKAKAADLRAVTKYTEG